MRRLAPLLFARGLIAAPLLFALAITLWASTPLLAQGSIDAPGTGSVEALRAGTEQRRPYWRGSGPERPFVAANFELGVLYFRPVLQLGYGKPHYQWFGAEGHVSPGLSGGRAYAGLRGVGLGIDARVGIRYDVPVSQDFLAPRASFDREDLEHQDLGRGRYLAGEAEVTGSFDALGGELFGVVTGYALFAIPDGVYVFEQSLKVVAEPPWMWRARAGYLYHLGWLGSMKLGAAVEAIHLITRDDVVVRVGPLLSVALTHHLEANGGIMIVAKSPDTLGLVGADIGQIGLRYRWATGDRWAEFP